MVDAGEYERLRDLRMHFQHLNGEQFVGTVEQSTGRKVRAFVSARLTVQPRVTGYYTF